MSHVTYTVVEHDGGWAYKVGDVFSETFPTRKEAHAAAERAAQEQRTPGESEPDRISRTVPAAGTRKKKGERTGPILRSKTNSSTREKRYPATRMSEFRLIGGRVFSQSPN